MVAGEARAETPLQFMQRFIANPAAVLNGKPRVKKARPAVPPIAAADVPLPRLRPSIAASSAPVLGYNAAADDEDGALDDMPMPRLRPADLLPAISAKPALGSLAAPPATRIDPPPPEQRVASLETEKPGKPSPGLVPLGDLVRPPPAATSTCGAVIAELGVIATPLAPIEEGECGVAAPVAISALEGGKIDLSGKAIVDCHVAERLATWVREQVAPRVRDELGGELTGLRVVDSYTCRTRDNIEGAKLSEHAHGDAIDISAFRVGKRWIEVGPGWNGGGDDATFLADVRKSACGPFTTVLGPGSDSFHTDHFHLDMIQRRTAGPSKGLYCK